MPLHDAATLTGLSQGQLLASSLFCVKPDPEDSASGRQLVSPKGYPYAKDLGYFDLAQKLRGKTRKPKKAGSRKINQRSINDRSSIDLRSINSSVEDQGLNPEKLDKSFPPPYNYINNTSSVTKTSSKLEIETSSSPEQNSELPKWAQGLTFPLLNGGNWNLTLEVIKNLRLVHKEVEIILQIKKALAWLYANPKRRKTSAGMPNFLLSWMNRATPEPQSVKSSGGFRAGGLL
jgi:hypothetical protein